VKDKSTKSLKDKFAQRTKDQLAKRVGYRCSNPNCRQLTSGPKAATNESVNVGHAAHITAASPDWTRYDVSLTSEQRKSFENGIWLCSKCATLIDIDKDAKYYTCDLLYGWKRLSEEAAQLEVEGKTAYTKNIREQDVELLKFYSQCLDRPAFQDTFSRGQRLLPNFDKAMEDTITAINTGCLRSRDGTILAQAKGKSYLFSRDWREKMDLIVLMLRTIRERFRTMPSAKSREDFRKFVEWMDATRDQIIRTFNEIGAEADIPALYSWNLYQE
jgi:hypothetical protein